MLRPDLHSQHGPLIIFHGLSYRHFHPLCLILQSIAISPIAISPIVVTSFIATYPSSSEPISSPNSFIHIATSKCPSKHRSLRSSPSNQSKYRNLPPSRHLLNRSSRPSPRQHRDLILLLSARKLRSQMSVIQ